MLVYDGLAIANSDVSQPHILKVAANVCERLCPGIDMQWSFKEHDFSIKDADDKKIGVFDIRNCERRPVMVSTEVTPESLAKLGPVFKFDTNFRCKCPKLAELLSSIRDMLDSNATPNQPDVQNDKDSARFIQHPCLPPADVTTADVRC